MKKFIHKWSYNMLYTVLVCGVVYLFVFPVVLFTVYLSDTMIKLLVGIWLIFCLSLILTIWKESLGYGNKTD